MATLTDVTTASILVRGGLERVSAVADRLDRETWVAPAQGDWTLVLPDAPAPAEARDEVDPYDLVGLGRALCHHGIDQVLILSVQDGYGVGQLMSRRHDTAFIGWRSAQSGEPPASRVDPDAYGFCARYGVPERTELVELLLEDVSGTPDLRLADLCRALGLPVSAVGVTGAMLSEERAHLAGAERHRRRRTGRWTGLRRLVG